MPVPKAILFDLDGVLLKSEEAWFKTLEAAGRRFRGQAITRDEFAPTFGQGTVADIATFKLDCTPNELDAFFAQEFLSHLPDVWVNPEAGPLLHTLTGEGLRCAVVTNSISAIVVPLLQRALLFASFEAVATVDRVQHAKPAPDLVLWACQALGVNTADAWLVGDSRFDAGAAKAAGVYFVGLGIDGDSRIEKLEALLPLLKAAQRT